MNDEALARIVQIQQALELTPTGLGLLNSVVVLPITDTARTETQGVPIGAVNLYYDGNDDLVFQAWNRRLGVWQETTLVTLP